MHTVIESASVQQEVSADEKTSVESVQQEIMSKQMTLKQRVLMVACPWKYFNEPKVSTRDCCLCGHESPLEESTIPPLVELSGTYIGDDPIPKWFVRLRVCITIYVIYAELFGIVLYAKDGDIGYFPIYFTHWTHTLCMISMIVKTYSTFKLRKTAIDALVKPLAGDDPIWKLYNWNSVLLQMSVPAMGMVTFFYFGQLYLWSIQYDSFLEIMDAIQMHGLTFIFIWLDFLLSAQRMYYKACIWSILFGTMFTLWTIIFEATINMNEDGDEYIYITYNWSEGAGEPTTYYFYSFILMVFFTSLATVSKNALLVCGGGQSQGGGDSEPAVNPAIQTNIIDI